MFNELDTSSESSLLDLLILPVPELNVVPEVRQSVTLDARTEFQFQSDAFGASEIRSIAIITFKQVLGERKVPNTVARIFFR